MPRTGVDPRAHGFHFANDFVDKVVTVPGFGEVATDGRAGGMAFAALDYWFAGLPVPSHRPEDFPDRAVPEDGSRLADFIHKRLFDSYATWSARQFLTWSLAEDHPTWSSPGVAKMTGESCPASGAASTPAGRWPSAWSAPAPLTSWAATARSSPTATTTTAPGLPAARRSACSSTTATTPTPRSCSAWSRAAASGRRAPAGVPGGGCSSRTTPASAPLH